MSERIVSAEPALIWPEFTSEESRVSVAITACTLPA